MLNIFVTVSILVFSAVFIHFLGFIGFFFLFLASYIIPPLHLEELAIRRNPTVRRPGIAAIQLFVAPLLLILSYLVLAFGFPDEWIIKLAIWSSDAKVFSLLTERVIIGVAGSNEFRLEPSSELIASFGNVSAIYIVAELYFLAAIGLITWSKLSGTEDFLRLSTKQFYENKGRPIRGPRYATIAFLIFFVVGGPYFILPFLDPMTAVELEATGSWDFVKKYGGSIIGTTFMLMHLNEYLFWDYIEDYINRERVGA